jgi:hypothetical protein
MSSTNQPLQALEASIQLARQNFEEAKIDLALNTSKKGFRSMNTMPNYSRLLPALIFDPTII